MNKNLLAFFLASLTLSGLFVAVSALSFLTAQPMVKIHIDSNSDVSNIVSAIAALHRPDVTIRTQKQASGGIFGTLGAVVFLAVGLMFISTLIGALYKLYCRWLGAEPKL